MARRIKRALIAYVVSFAVAAFLVFVLGLDSLLVATFGSLAFLALFLLYVDFRLMRHWYGRWRRRWQPPA